MVVYEKSSDLILKYFSRGTIVAFTGIGFLSGVELGETDRFYLLP